MNLGEKIKYYRNQLNLSQEQLAQKSELSRNAIYNYENDKRVPTMDILIKISNALDVDIEELIGREKIIYSDAMKEIEKLIEKYPEHESEITETVDNLSWCIFYIYMKKGCNNRDIAKSNMKYLNKLLSKIRELFEREIVISPIEFPLKYTKQSLKNISEITEIANSMFFNELAIHEPSKSISQFKEGE